MKKILNHPRLVIAVIAVITVFFAVQIPRAELDNNTFRFVPDDNPARMDVERVDKIFGGQTYILVGLSRTYATVLEPDFLTKLRDFGKKVNDLQGVDSITSLVETDYISGEGDSIRVEPIVGDSFTGTPDEVAVLKERILEWDIYRRALISDDFRSTQLLVTLSAMNRDAGSRDTIRSYDEIKRLAAETGFTDTEVYITGLPAFTSVMNHAMRSDLIILIPLVAIVVLFVLFLSFRRIGGIVLPMLTVFISTVWSVGLMTLLGIKLTMIATVLPVILIAVGSAYGIHIVSHYYDETAGRKKLDDAEHRELILSVVRRVGRPVLLAALTTLAGFGSLCFTSVVPIFEFGIFSSFGVLTAFLTAVTLIPSLLILRGPAGPSSPAGAGSGGEDDAHLENDRISAGIANGFGSMARHPWIVLTVAIAVTALGFLASSRMILDNVIVEYFKPDTEIARSDVFIRKQFGGSRSVSVVVTGENRGDVLHPDVLKAMDDLGTYLTKNVSEVGKVTGFQDLVKRMNQVFNSDEPAAGIAARPAGGEGDAGDTTSFGFGEPAGASGSGAETGDDFGFSGFEDSGTAPAEADALPSAATVKTGGMPLDELAAVALISKAWSSAGGGEMSAGELVAQLAKKVNYKGAAYYEIPSDPARYGKVSREDLKLLVGNYLLLLSGNVSEWADDPLEPKTVRMNIQLRTVGQLDSDRALDVINSFVKERFPKNVKVELVGTALVEGELNEMVVNSQLVSIVTSLLMVFLILAVFYRSVTAGLIGIVPLAVSIIINFAIMGLTGIKLNIGTAMIASVTVGIGVDYIIHYMASYHHEKILGTDPSRFLRRTFLTSGKAILFNAASVGAGFAVLMLSQFNMLAYFGGLIALTMFTSSFVSLTVLPALLRILKPKFIERPLSFQIDAGTASENNRR